MSDEVETVPKARLDAVIEARKAAETKVAALEAKVAELGALPERLESVMKELEGFKAKESAWSEERDILAAGITDPEGVEFTRVAWNKVAEKPEGGIKAWIAGGKLPKAVAAYLPSAAPAEPSPSKAPANTAVSGFNVATPVSVGGTGQKLTPAEIQDYAQRAVTGAISKEEWAKIRADVMSGRR